MKTSSCKAKGRGFQQKIRDMYRELGVKRGLVDADIESRGMGQQGVDLIFSPAALAVFLHSIECKKHRRVSVPTQFKKHFDKYKTAPALKLLYHENDNSESLVTLRAADFMHLLGEIMQLEDAIQNQAKSFTS